MIFVIFGMLFIVVGLMLWVFGGDYFNYLFFVVLVIIFGDIYV